MTTVGIVNYGLGNLRSVAGAVIKLGHGPIISADPDELALTDKLILPGVGAFRDGMKNLHARGLVDPLSEMVAAGKPLLGICLGFQLIAQESDEFGTCEGLGWVAARVRRLEPADQELRVPHVGWNDLEQCADSPLYRDVPADALFYFVHSYQLVPEDEGIVIGHCDYGGRFVAAIARDNICGVQFHPEKSQQHGLTLIDNFLSSS